MKNKLSIASAFEGTYVLGAIVMISELVQRLGDDVNEVNLKVACNVEDLENIQLFRDIMKHLGVICETIELVTDESKRRRYNSPVALSKFYFLRTERAPLLWIDADTISTSNFSISDYKESTEDFLVVPRGGDCRNFNSGVFFANRTPFEIDLSTARDSDFYTDQHILQDNIGPLANELAPEHNHLSIWAGDHQTPHSVRIYHYVGEIKPWFISRAGRDVCIRANCDYAHWFRAEKTLLSLLQTDKELLGRYLAAQGAAVLGRRKVIGPASRFAMRLQARNSTSQIRLFSLLLSTLARVRPKTFGRHFLNMHPFHS